LLNNGNLFSGLEALSFLRPAKKTTKRVEKKLGLNEFLDALNLGFEILPMQRKMVEFACEKGVRQLLGQRDIGKTTIPVVVATIWKIYNDPTKTIQIICGDYGKAKDILYFAGVVMKNSNLFKGLHITRTQIRTLQNATKKVKKEPSIFIGSLKTTLRGKHPSEVIFDDLLTMETSIYKAYRLRAKRIYEEALSLTQNILIIGQPTHPQDLYAELRLKPEVKKLEIWNGDIPERTANIDNLRATGMSDYTIYANYYGKLIADDSLPFSEVLTMNLDDFPKFEGKMFAYYDFSYGKNDSNSLAICFLYNMKVYILGFSKVCRWSDFITETISVLQELSIDSVVFENNITGSEPVHHFKQHGINAFEEHTTENKVFKIAKMYQYSKDMVLLIINDSRNQHFISQFKAYSPIDSNCMDDAVDSVAMNLIAMNFINLTKG
jgi:hypothetical protein